MVHRTLCSVLRTACPQNPGTPCQKNPGYKILRWRPCVCHGALAAVGKWQHCFDIWKGTCRGKPVCLSLSCCGPNQAQSSHFKPLFLMEFQGRLQNTEKNSVRQHAIFNNCKKQIKPKVCMTWLDAERGLQKCSKNKVIKTEMDSLIKGNCSLLYFFTCLLAAK